MTKYCLDVSNRLNTTKPMKCPQTRLNILRILGTAIPYGCNDNIKSIEDLSSQSNNNINFDEFICQKSKTNKESWPSIPYITNDAFCLHRWSSSFYTKNLYPIPLTLLNSIYKTRLDTLFLNLPHHYTDLWPSF